MHTFNLPNANGTIYNGTVDSNSIIIIGANGAGKSHLGAWIEKNNVTHVHRIGAQRSLIFGEYIQQKSYEQSTNLLFCGENTYKQNHDKRWGWDGSKYNYTSSMLNDYEHVLSALIAKKTLQQEKYIKECKEREKEGLPHNDVPEMITDKLKRIWKSVFPHRELEIADGKVIARLQNKEQIKEYVGRDMSDGERVVLYLLAQALLIPDGKVIIIDEPEIHLHRSIMNRLWSSVEHEREDCLFIYITHDTQFAANHREAKKIWVKSFDGANWEWEEVEDGELPEQLLLDILGNRKPVIFVEGTVDSYDTKLYSEVFNKYYVVPCGSCSSVIAWTKAMNNTKQLHDLKCYGIIDRDYRTDYEIENYKDDNIYTLKVAEVENLFLIPELLEIVNSILGYKDEKHVDEIINYIIEDRFSKEIHRQICESVVSDLKYRLTIANLPKKDEDEAKVALNNLIESISYDEIKREHQNKFNLVLEGNNYKDILKVFNRKSLVTSIGHFFGIDNKGYCDFVIRQLRTDKAQEIIEAIDLYLPNEIPR